MVITSYFDDDKPRKGLHNFFSSILKWQDFHAHVVKLDSSTSTAERSVYWDNEMWNACGFCREFLACRNCPLHEVKACIGTLSLSEDTTDMHKIYDAYINITYTRFHRVELADFLQNKIQLLSMINTFIGTMVARYDHFKNIGGFDIDLKQFKCEPDQRVTTRLEW